MQFICRRCRSLLLRVVKQTGIFGRFLACTVHVAFVENAQYGIHHAIVRGDVSMVRLDVEFYELGHSDFVNMRMVLECPFNILHVGTSTGEDNATQQTVGIFCWHLAPYILYDFHHAAFDNLHELAVLHTSFIVNGQHQRTVDIIVVGIGCAIFQFHFFCHAFLNLQRGDVFGDVVATKRNNCDMTKLVLVIYRNGGGICPEVNEHTARAAFSVG